MHICLAALAVCISALGSADAQPDFGGGFLRGSRVDFWDGDAELDVYPRAMGLHAATADQLSGSCGSMMLMCAPGAWGSGGCYRTSHHCSNGMICSTTQRVCAPTSWGPGGCYSNGYRCNYGTICPVTSLFCAPGAWGRGGCYRPGSRCVNGMICSSQQARCGPSL